MIEKMLARVNKVGLEIINLKKYNSLKLKTKIEKKNLLNQIDELVQQLAEARYDIEVTKTKEKLARKQIKDLKEVIKEDKNGSSN